ncbi:MAG: hypothetical protein JKX85_08820 [Phycisphaeraceae bacterium]|nr:hypothetical protein [Phycisphaeraceae bacterium]
MSARWTQQSVTRQTQPRGIAMVLVLIALAMATVLGLSFLNTQSTTTGIAQNVTSQSRARGIAESAMSLTANFLRTESNWRGKGEGTWIVKQALDGGTFTISVLDGEIDSEGNVAGDNDLADEVTDHIVIKAVGHYNGVSHTITAEVTPKAGDATPAKVVLVVANANALNTQEGLRKLQLSEWGYEVSVVSASANLSVFNGLSKITDVFLVSETISSGDLGAKLLHTGSGVVNEEGGLYDDFRLTSGSASQYNDTQIDVTDSSHYITSTLGNGVATVFSNAQNMQYASSSLPSGVTVLATHPNNDDPALIAVEAGVKLQSGKASGRRVFLPWAASDLDFASLNSTGLVLLKRSIDWASQSESAPPATLHYDFSGNSATLIEDQGGNVDLQLYPGNGTITRVTDANGTGIVFGQNASDGTAVAMTTASGNTQQLAAAIQEAGAVTVQVFFKQTNGGNVLSMGNKPTITTNSLNNQATYVEFADVLNDPNTMIFYSKSHDDDDDEHADDDDDDDDKKKSDKYDDDDDDDDQEHVANDNFYIQGSPSGGSFNHALYLSHQEGEQALNQNDTWENDTPVVYAFTFDKEDGTVRIYINGQQVAEENMGDTDLDNWVSQWLTLGNSPSLDSPFVGTIYDVKIWPSQLSEAQLKDNAQAFLDGDDNPLILVLYEFQKIVPAAPKPISHWKLDETTGSGDAMYGSGVSADDEFKLEKGAQIEGFRSSDGNYSQSNSGLNVIATVNSIEANKENKFKIKGNQTILVGDALCGAGGNPNTVIEIDKSALVTGTTGAQAVNMQLPDKNEFIVPTDGRPSNIGKVEYKDDAVVTISSNLYTDDFKVEDNAHITISGDVTIWCENFELKDDDAKINVPVGSSLTVYASGDIKIKDGAQLNYQNNETTGATRVAMFTTDDKKIEIEDSGTIAVGNFYSTKDLKIKKGAKLYGTASCGKKMEVKDENTHLYVDLDQVNNNKTIDQRGVSNGIYTNGPTSDPNGKFASAIKFDGINDFVSMSHSDVYLIYTGTISFWFKANDISGTQGLFSKDSFGTDSGGQLSIYLEGSTLRASLESASDSMTVSHSAISTDTWYHVAFSFGPAGMKLVVDGSVADTDPYTGGMATTSGGNYEPIVLGASTMSSDNLVATPVVDYFNGYMDEVRIYGSQLSLTQIATVIENGDPVADSAVGVAVKDTGGYGEPLDMTVKDPENITWDSSGGLTFNSPTRVVSDMPASKITTALNASGALTMEIIFTPANLEQQGNLVSISSDRFNRDLGFAQDDVAYNFSLRSTGNSNDVESSDVLTVAQQHLVITWDGSVIKVYRNGRLESTESLSGDLSNWSETLPLIMGNQADGSAPWLGPLKRFAIYDQTLNSFQVQDLFNGELPRANTETQPVEFHVRWYENP